MKTIQQTIPFIIAICFASITWAQNLPSNNSNEEQTLLQLNPKTGNFTLYTRPTALFEPYAKIGLGFQQRITKDLYIKQSFSYVDTYLPGFWEDIKWGAESRTGLKLVVSSSDNPKRFRESYVSGELMLRSQKAYSLDFRGSTGFQQQSVVAGRVLFGQHFFFKNGIFMDWYTGLGIKYKNPALLTVTPVIAGGFDIGFTI